MKTLSELGKYQRQRRLVIAIVISLLALALLFVRSSWSVRVHELIESIGLSFIVVAILGRMWCTLYIGGRKSAEIVQSGPYSITRNPLYVFSTIGAMGIGAQTGSIIIAIGFGVFCYAAFSIVICTEEKFLEQNFGEPYRTYCYEVPRFFPRLSLFRDETIVMVRPDRLYRTFMDGLVFFVAYPFFEYIGYLQGLNVLPVFLYLY